MDPAAVNKALNVLWANRFETNRELIDIDVLKCYFLVKVSLLRYIYLL